MRIRNVTPEGANFLRFLYYATCTGREGLGYCFPPMLMSIAAKHIARCPECRAFQQEVISQYNWSDYQEFEEALCAQVLTIDVSRDDADLPVTLITDLSLAGLLNMYTEVERIGKIASVVAQMRSALLSHFYGIATNTDYIPDVPEE